MRNLKRYVWDELNVIVTGVFALLVYSYCVFFRPFTFNFEPSYFEHYYIQFISIALLSFNLITKLFDIINGSFKVSAHYLIALVCVCFCVADLFISDDFSNEHLAFIMLFLVFYLCLVDSVRLVHLRIMGLIILLFYISQLILSYAQVFGYGSSIRSLDVTGSLRNSGVFSCYLVVHIPLAYRYLFSTKRLLLRTAFLVILFSTLYILYVTQSRTAVLTLLVIGFVAVKRYFGSLKKIFGARILLVSYILLAVVFLAYIGYLFVIKSASSNGRALILDITFRHIFDNLWSGVGIGRFTHNYPLWQIQYFTEHASVNRAYFLSAGESYMAFNEFLQIFVEIGLIRFIILVVFISSLVFAKAKIYCVDLSMAMLIFLAVMLCCLTSYPLHSIPILFILFFSLLIISFCKKAEMDWSVYFNRGILAIALLVLFLGSITLLIRSYSRCSAVAVWQATNNDDKPIQMKINEFSFAYLNLKGDNKFLICYAELLASYYDKSPLTTSILKQANETQITYRGLELFADALIYTGDYFGAFKIYRTMAYFIPNKFRPKYKMVRLLQKMGKLNEAKKIAEQIIAMPVKMPSDEVTNMISEMHFFLNTSKVITDKKSDLNVK